MNQPSSVGNSCGGTSITSSSSSSSITGRGAGAESKSESVSTHQQLTAENDTLKVELMAVRAELVRYQEEQKYWYSAALSPTHSTSPTKTEPVSTVTSPSTSIHSPFKALINHLLPVPTSPLSLESTLQPGSKSKLNQHPSSDELDILNSLDSKHQPDSKHTNKGLKHRKHHYTPLKATASTDDGTSLSHSASPKIKPDTSITPQRHSSNNSVVRQLAASIAPYRKDSNRTYDSEMDIEASTTVTPLVKMHNSSAPPDTADTVATYLFSPMTNHPQSTSDGPRANGTGTRYTSDQLETGTTPLVNTTPPFFAALQDRAGWLVGLLVLQSLSSFIISRNETLLQNHLVIVRFLTMLVGAGGNAGNQASVGVIRGLATGTVHNHNLKDTIRRELAMALSLSLILGVAGMLRAALFFTPATETFAITICLMAIVFISILLGTVLPMLMKSFRIDPAHSSTTIQVIMDILGVLITVQLSGCILDSSLGKLISPGSTMDQ